MKSELMMEASGFRHPRHRHHIRLWF